jgi:hypothetical protein
MSRILRRPMFRGGRVDSRGTGIASGLSYEKGGRVGYLTGGSTGNPFNINLGGSNPSVSSGRAIYSSPAGPQLPKGLTYRGILDAMKTGGKGMLGRLAGFNPFSAAGITMALPFAPSYFMAKANEPRTVEALEYMKSMNDSGVFDETGALDYEDFTKQIDILNQTGTPLKDSGVGLTTSQEDLSKLVDDIRIKKEKEEANKNKETDTSTGTGTDEPSSDDLLNIDKEKFAELLGSKEARGEDISNMLLSFAGKALKDDATVKSSFSEFFEEEAKRPSSKTKVDQAAAQLAINKYIKGEISRAELNKLIALNKMKTNISPGQAYARSKSSGFTARVKDAALETLSNPKFEVVESKDMVPVSEGGKFQFSEEDIGVIYIETDTKESYTFDEAGNKVTFING